MSDQIAIVHDGRLVQSGPPAASTRRPRTRFVADFLGKSNFISGTVEAVDGARFTYAAGGERYVQAAGPSRRGRASQCWWRSARRRSRSTPT